MMNNKKKTFSILILRPNGKQSLQIQLSTLQIKAILSVIIISSALIFYSIYFGTEITTKRMNYKTLQKKTVEQEQEIEQIKILLDSQELELQNIIEKEKRIRKLLLGKSRIQHRNISRYLNNEKKKHVNNTIIESIKNNITRHKDITEKLDTNLTSHLKKSQQYKSKYRSTPSINPVFGGYIRSSYGWRTHPILKRKKFHRGVDIAAWKGAPIQATADGIVEYAGWIRGFGYSVILRHNFGYKTIYGHCSQLLTKNGDFIKKGQVIAQVGSTGMSTGDHLHYEVKKWNKSISPTPYLDADIFEANSKI